MAVFVTGAGGFLGQTLVNTLIGQGKQVLAFDYNAPPEATVLKTGLPITSPGL
ncbi:hypothetical protein FACS1894137_18340 [Spirochaetia bacterium]|nr:hypothetical protein FACS1894137_18340 [Spirochaetia bacterium]